MVGVTDVGSNYFQGTIDKTQASNDVNRVGLESELAIDKRMLWDATMRVTGQSLRCRSAQQKYDEAVVKMHAGVGDASIVARCKGELDAENAKLQTLRDDLGQMKGIVDRLAGLLNLPSSDSKGDTGTVGQGDQPATKPAGQVSQVGAISLPPDIQQDLEAYALYVINGMQKNSEARARGMLDEQKARNDQVTQINALISKLGSAPEVNKDDGTLKLFDPEATQINNLLGPNDQGVYPLDKKWVIAWTIDGKQETQEVSKEDYDKWMGREGEIDWKGSDSTSHSVSCADWGGSGNPEFHFNKDQVNTIKETLKAKVDTLTSDGQLANVNMQSAINQANQAQDLASNLAAAFKRTDDNIVGNIKS